MIMEGQKENDMNLSKANGILDKMKTLLPKY
jgi:hypothetical protein